MDTSVDSKNAQDDVHSKKDDSKIILKVDISYWYESIKNFWRQWIFLTFLNSHIWDGSLWLLMEGNDIGQFYKCEGIDTGSQ